nr:iron ABC transporter permease [Paenibacillus thermoaerophilus]
MWLACAGCIFAVFYVSLTNGTFDMSVREVLNTLLRIDPVPEHDLVIFEFRLPRIIVGALVGFGLGAAGAVIQGITRNELADPGILGINAGAGAAIVLFMFWFHGHFRGLDLLGIFAMPLFGLVGGLLAAVLIYWFSRVNGRLDPQRLILVGIAIGFGFGALALYVSLKMNPQDFEMATVWLTGSIWSSNWSYIGSMLPWLLVLIPIVIGRARILDLYQLGEDGAKSLGVRTEMEKHMLLLCSIGIISVCVSVSGNIGFVGLLSPHIAKRLAGLHHRRVIPLGGAIGMLLVMASDFIAKTVFAPVELPVGIVIAIVGVPYFVYLLYKTRGVI